MGLYTLIYRPVWSDLLYLLLSPSAETEVSDPHCETARRRTQGLYHRSAARGTNTDKRLQTGKYRVPMSIVFMRLFCVSGHYLYQGGVGRSS